jgi:hypothetical protein
MTQLRATIKIESRQIGEYRWRVATFHYRDSVNEPYKVFELARVLASICDDSPRAEAAFEEMVHLLVSEMITSKATDDCTLTIRPAVELSSASKNPLERG